MQGKVFAGNVRKLRRQCPPAETMSSRRPAQARLFAGDEIRRSKAEPFYEARLEHA